MPRLLKRWYVWLALVLLLGLTGSAALICSNQSRITQANFDRIQDGMSEEEVIAILGSPKHSAKGERGWTNGPSGITVWFRDDKVVMKAPGIATVGKTLKWYVKKCAMKIGVKWD